MRHEKAFLEKLATWRELSQEERSAIREHAADCPPCQERLALYDRQDRLLGALPGMASRVTYADVRGRVAVRRAPFAAQRAWAVAFVLLLFLGLSAGAVAASGDAIPGDLLYPIKMRVEATRLWMASDEADRDELSARFAENRRIEAQALLALNRSAEMDIAGSVTDVRGHNWTLSGLEVTVPREIWQGEPPAVGQRLEMRIEVRAQEMRALKVRFLPHDAAEIGPGQPETGPGDLPTEPGNATTELSASPRGASPSNPPATTKERIVRTAMPEPTGTPIRTTTSTRSAETPPGPVATFEAGAPATETVVPVSQPGPTGSPEPGPAGPTRTPTGPQGGQQGSGGR